MHQQRKPSNLTPKSRIGDDKQRDNAREDSFPYQTRPLLLRSSATLLLGTSADEERTFCRRLELPRKRDFCVDIRFDISISQDSCSQIGSTKIEGKERANMKL